MQASPSESTARLRKVAGSGPKRRGAGPWIFLAVSLAAAVGTAALVMRYIDSRLRTARVPTVPVVVAAKELPLAATLTAEMLEVIAWPKEGVPEGTFSDPAAVVGRVISVKLSRSEPILDSKLAAAGAGAGLAAILPPDRRAVAVRVDDVVGVAGFIHPGDSVDVIVTMKPTDSAGALATAKVILQNIRVLAVGKQLEPEADQKKKVVEATVATLMVDSAEAEKLALAAAKGKLLLALRSSVDTEVIETPGIVPPVLLASPIAEPPPPAPATPAAKKPARAAPPRTPAKPATTASDESVVEILRGDRMEERSFKEK